jgi:hypothetical protein
MSSQAMRQRTPVLLGIAAALLLLAFSGTQAASLKTQNLTHLISESESIIEGTVESVTDGIDENGFPYTEVTLFVRSSAKGAISGETEYTFRQFGLTRPRTMENGQVMLAVNPQGFPTWTEGETVVAFLYKPASMTGLQTTAGMAQGKLSRNNDRLFNEFGNEGLFEGVEINDGLLTPEERNMLTTPGNVDAELFMNLVHRAVSEQWIENGEMQ